MTPEEILQALYDETLVGNGPRVLELTASEPGSPSLVRSFPGDYRYYLERIAREESGEDGLTLHLLWTERQKTGFEALTSERGNDA